MTKSKYYLYVGPWTIRVPRFVWMRSNFAGHIDGGGWFEGRQEGVR